MSDRYEDSFNTGLLVGAGAVAIFTLTVLLVHRPVHACDRIVRAFKVAEMPQALHVLKLDGTCKVQE